MRRIKELSDRDRISVGILGATGAVGQQFILLLADHPWFRIDALAASDASAGKKYCDVVDWQLSQPIPEEIGNLIVQKCDPELGCSVFFSALDNSVAGDIETAFAEKGKVVISNARAHRNDSDVPLLVPEVNSKHLALLKKQKEKRTGIIVTNPNCSVIGLTIALKPLDEFFGLEAVQVVTLQAISGAGHSDIDIMDNIIPYIEGEEEKIESEPLKILGRCFADAIEPATFTISAQATRVPISYGHMACVSVKLKEKPSMDRIIHSWEKFSGEAQMLELPLVPPKPIQYFDDVRYPQPKLHRDLHGGMTVSIGRLRECPLYDYKFVILSHNTIRGAAGCAVLNAELLVNHGYIFW